MAFSHRLATLAAVVAIPLGIAATSYALTDAPHAPEVPPRVELTGGPGRTTDRPAAPPSSPAPDSPSAAPSGAPTGDSVVPGPSPRGDDDDDDPDERPGPPGNSPGDDAH
ncbi:small hydrophilic protein [Streptomyces sp. NPDC004111]|uniref:small hydrophilic protein n=1 Tax=Streptomyces sp. NPDC004111 TaxID=3364690 RepID=UPI0036B24B64